MSVQINQYLMYGVSVHKSWPKEWAKKHGKDWGDEFESFMDDSAYKAGVKHRDGIFCLYDGMSGEYIIIGKVLQKSIDGEYIAGNGPISIEDLPNQEKSNISDSIKRNFGITGELKHWFVTHYR